MNWSIIIPIGIVALAFIVFLTWKNIKDEKKVVDDIKQDYPKPKAEEEDTDTEEITK